MSVRDFDDEGHYALMDELEKSQVKDEEHGDTVAVHGGAFIMLNGMNEGVGLIIRSAERLDEREPRHWLMQACAGSIAKVAGKALTAGRVEDGARLRLYATDGTPLSRKLTIAQHSIQPLITEPPKSRKCRADEDKPKAGDTVRLCEPRDSLVIIKLHLLLPDENWVWPGIRVGYQWSVEDAHYKTLSIEPKVILIKDVITPSLAKHFVAHGEKQLYRSPEKHYSDDPKFKNYRTSMTASPDGPSSRDIQIRSSRLARLSTPEYCEPPQLTRYGPGEWYKQHQDFFHGWEDRKSNKHQGGGLAESRAGLAYQALRDESSGRLAEEETGGVLLSRLPKHVTERKLKLTDAFEYSMIYTLLESEEKNLKALITEDWREWLEVNMRNRATLVLTQFMIDHPANLEIQTHLVAAWKSLSGIVHRPPPETHIKDRQKTQPNRHVTLFLYLNDDFEGGETVFPDAKDIEKHGAKTPRPGMSECSRGLAVEPVAGGGALFYSKLGNGEMDHLSMHGGCPPLSGVKFGANAFMWDRPHEEGLAIWQEEGLM